MKFTKVERGWYATEDGTYAVMSDGYEFLTAADAAQSAHYEGVTHEWAALHDPQGRLREDTDKVDALDWFPTKRQAEEYLNNRV